MSSQDNSVVYICGEYATGKGTLTRLLDGHCRLAVTPVHDQLTKLLVSDPSNYNSDNAIEQVQTDEIRKSLAKTGYYLFQEFHYEGIKTYLSSEDLHRESIQNFEFYTFEDEWMTNIRSDTTVSSKTLMLNILQSFFNNWNDFDQENSNQFVGMGSNSVDEVYSLMTSFDNSTAIVIKRDPRDIVASVGARETSSWTIDKLLTDYKIKDVLEYYSKVSRLKNEFPERIEVIEFDDLILNTDETMKQISEFLSISHAPILTEPTYCGNSLEQDYLGEIHDQWEDILTNKQQALANFQLNEQDISQLEYAPNHLSIVLRNEIKNIFYDVGKPIYESL